MDYGDIYQKLELVNFITIGALVSEEITNLGNTLPN